MGSLGRELLEITLRCPVGGNMSLGVVGDFQSQVKKLFKGDSTVLDNFVFQLHHKYSFVVILIGILFISCENYLNDSAITCVDGNDYINNFCFLHGAAHIPENLTQFLSPVGSRCVVEGNSDSRTTNYYIWLPFVLTLCAVVTKFPRLVWKNVLERGMMDKLVLDAQTDKDGVMEKNISRFYKVALKKSWQARIYNFGFAFCELLNIVAVVINREILDRLLKGQFYGYGHDAVAFFSYEPHPNALDDAGVKNPLCNVFPTEVSCSVNMGSITGNADITNTLCLLSNNVFNQYFFLILWFWWVILLSISCLGVVYRIAQICVPGVAKMRLNAMLNMLAVGQKNQLKIQDLDLATTEVFLLTRLVSNLKGSEVNRLIEAIPGKKKGDFSLGQNSIPGMETTSLTIDDQ